MLDDKTYKIVKSDFLNAKQKLKKSKIQKFRQALKAIHTNLHVSEVKIVTTGNDE
jgi:ribosomal protein S7